MSVTVSPLTPAVDSSHPIRQRLVGHVPGLTVDRSAVEPRLPSPWDLNPDLDRGGLG